MNRVSGISSGVSGGSGVLSNPLSQAVAAEAKKASIPSSSTSSNLKVNSSLHSSSQQGIWSTMKHLMRQGNHHNNSPSANHQFSHAQMNTLAGNPPNVVDLTTTSANTNTISNTKRPWSKQARVLRNATIQDITAHGMIHTSAISKSAASSDAMMAHHHQGAYNNAGFKRLWRGVQTMFVGCIPAHALYFSSYEMIKSMCTDQNRRVHHHSHNQQQHQHDQSMNNGEPQQQQQQHEGGGHVGHDTLSPTQAMLAGGVATLLHDFVMTPMDTMKQRMQLGHYDNLRHAFVSIVWGDKVTNTGSTGENMLKSAGEGWKGLYRSFPITVMTNVPYGMIMMTTNEWLRGVLEDGLYGIHENQYEENPFHLATIMISGMGAGTIASAATAPLDRVKTRLQTQRMGMVLPSARAASASSTTAAAVGSAIMEERALAAAQGKPKICPKMAVQDVKRTLFPSSSAATSTSASASTFIPSSMTNSIQQHAPKTSYKTYYTTPFEAFQSILQEEGPRGLFRGTLPRVALHAPSVAISWTAYEMAKDWLVWLQ
mmetsp:Transcript_17057/g.36802  ORF Transcript_17057/g.36802 Transcript_17057/m.36802 type:complete len:542 (+) Transcript_17057:563-2188(+)